MATQILRSMVSHNLSLIDVINTLLNHHVPAFSSLRAHFLRELPQILQLLCSDSRFETETGPIMDLMVQQAAMQMSKEMTDLSHTKHGFHYNAKRVSIEDIRRFNGVEVARKYETTAKHTWNTIQALLQSFTRARREVSDTTTPVPVHTATSITESIDEPDMEETWPESHELDAYVDELLQSESKDGPIGSETQADRGKAKTAMKARLRNAALLRIVRNHIMTPRSS